MADQDAQIFVFTAGDPSARAHLDDSIRQAVKLDLVLSHAPAEQHASLRQMNDSHGLYSWGAIPGVQNTPRWESMKPGDWALCVYDSTYHYVAQVLLTLNNEALARAIWGSDDQGRTWSLMYFLSKPVEANVRVSDVADYLNQGYMGFARIGDERQHRIVSDFGSIANFIDKRLMNATLSAAKHPFDAITREHVLDALKKIDAGEMHGFGPSTDYDLLHEGKRYPPKAAAGIATIPTLGRAMRPDEFSAGVGSKNFKTLEKLGFQIVLKDASQYFLIRSNPSSPYSDEIGKKYHFNSNVPNHKKLISGAKVVVDSKRPDGTKVLGYGDLLPADEDKKIDAPTEYVCTFSNWTPFADPRSIAPAVLAQVQAQPSFNVQHAIRPITKRIFDLLIGESDMPSAENELCLLGTYKGIEADVQTIQNAIETRGGWASWWSFSIKKEAQAHLQAPFYLYLNRGGASFSHRMLVEKFETSHGTDGIESPWPQITNAEWLNKKRLGDKQSDVCKTWLFVREIETLPVPLALADFLPAAPWSSDTNVLNQNSFGYAYRASSAAPETEPYSVTEAMNGVFMEEEDFVKILELLRTKKNLILQGAPGTGKTFVAKRLAYALMGTQAKDRVSLVQFHQSYSYEDFMGGYRPVENDNGGGFAFRKGIFYRFCDRARLQPDKTFVFVIDEINRGNLSKIFGEIMMLVEADKRGESWGMPLTYSKEADEPFYVPENVYILGLMNTADRSLAMVDYALRRRFAFWSLRPAFESERLATHLQSCGLSHGMVERIRGRMVTLNQEIEADRDLGRGFVIGHSFFCSPNVDDEVAWYERVIGPVSNFVGKAG